MLPQMTRPDGIGKWRSVDFGGIRHVPGAGNGEIWDCFGVTPDAYPVLRSGEFVNYDSAPKGVFGSLQFGVGENQRVYVNRSALYYMDKAVYAAYALSGMQQIVAFQNFALLFPAQIWVRTDVRALCDSAAELPESPAYGDVYAVRSGSEYDAKCWDGSAWTDVGKMAGVMRARVTVGAAFVDGTCAGVPAEANTIEAVNTALDWSAWFSAGDAVTISGAADAENNITLIIREIDGFRLRFYENSFKKNTAPATITVERTVPDMDWVCVNESRVWGCKGQRIYASKLGDFRNWNVFDGLATDSYAVDVLSAGDFTGCVSFMGYPVFFKRTGIYKVYGNRPSNFEVMGSASTGCVNGHTLAVAAETLFYLSARGVMRYGGGVPQCVSRDLGALITGGEDAFGGSDGDRYWFAYGGGTEAFVYDPEKGMWHKQRYADAANPSDTLRYAYTGHDGVVLVTAAGRRYGRITAAGSQSDAFCVEFADFTEDQSRAPQYGANKKGTGKLQLRMALGENAAVTVSMMFDSDGVWRPVKTFTAASVKRSFYLPIIPRRSDHFRIRFEGHGSFELYSLSRENYKGSAL